MRKFFRFITCVAAVFSASAFAAAIYGNECIPDTDIGYGNSICYKGVFYAKTEQTDFVSVSTDDGNTREVQLSLLNVIPVKTMTLKTPERRYVYVGGELIGIRLATEGLCVVGTEKFETESGVFSPAEKAGICSGDILLEANGKKLADNETFTELIRKSGGKEITLTVKRGEEIFSTVIAPIKSNGTGMYKCGIWIRDSAGGIGTLSYSDVSTGTIAALGHGIYDADTSSLLPSSDGLITSAFVSAVEKGSPGKAGQICGVCAGTEYGTITENTEKGIYGGLTSVFPHGDAYPVASAAEVHSGPAQIICTVNGEGKKTYDIEIEKAGSISGEGKDMVIRITDTALLSLTGGIVQGMSGSPILQDGMLAGAVTHVFLNDPKRGYGIYAEEMLDLSDNASVSQKKAS